MKFLTNIFTDSNKNKRNYDRKEYKKHKAKTRIQQFKDSAGQRAGLLARTAELQGVLQNPPATTDGADRLASVTTPTLDFPYPFFMITDDQGHLRVLTALNANKRQRSHYLG